MPQEGYSLFKMIHVSFYRLPPKIYRSAFLSNILRTVLWYHMLASIRLYVTLWNRYDGKLKKWQASELLTQT